MTTAPLDAALLRAVSLQYDGRFRDAETIYRQLIGRPDATAMAHYMYAQLKLLQGEYETGWSHFMHRLDTPFYLAKGTAALTQPLWDGGDFPGMRDQSLLVHADEGIGDAIMCARYLSLLADRFDNVKFGVFSGFSDLFSSLDVDVVEFGQTWSGFDSHVHLFSLPALLNSTPSTIPPAEYLSADPEKVAKWHSRFEPDVLNVGLAWQGNPDHERDHERSLHLSCLEPVLKVPGVKFHRLQIGHGVEQIAALGIGDLITDWSPDIGDESDRMIETAAAITCLDLVISIDSALAHLAGALDTPAWVMLPMVPDWRWGLEGPETPWYPKARLFRCKDRNNWKEPVSDIAGALARLT